MYKKAKDEGETSYSDEANSRQSDNTVICHSNKVFLSTCSCNISTYTCNK